MSKFKRLFNTVKYLKIKQIYYRLFYFVRDRVRKITRFKYDFLKKASVSKLQLKNSIENKYSLYDNRKFSFLNLEYKVENTIDWNYNEHGKLWTYNLTYFEYLKNKEDISLVYDFIENIHTMKDGLEPFPISLRGMNWIKFLSKFNIEDKKIDDCLYAQYYILLDNLEYHLLGNHLLENGFSLLFGAYYFRDDTLYTKAKEILEVELEEQVLDDGAHFELSPMYHQIMLFRVLDCINLIEKNDFKDKELLELLTVKASVMLGWLENMTFSNGNIPLLNDSANGIAPSSKELFAYADTLGLKILTTKLSKSGYRKVSNENYESIVDIGNIGADYIPGHAHSDTFNFVVQKDEKEFIVDSGLSTYETNERRTYERSTASHNTVEVNIEDQSEVWGGFRVANRAVVIELYEHDNIIKAAHDGYKKDNILHTREWKFEDRKIVIKDTLNNSAHAVFRLHFHSTISKKMILASIVCIEDINIVSYKYAPEFNKLIDALAIEITFEKELKVEINI